jgi:hypothetical protein
MQGAGLSAGSNPENAARAREKSGFARTARLELQHATPGFSSRPGRALKPTAAP